MTVRVGQQLVDDGHTRSALTEFVNTPGWRDAQQDAARRLTDLPLEAAPAERLAALEEACEWLEVTCLAAEVLPEANAWVEPWLARTEALVATLEPSALSFRAIGEASASVHHAWRAAADHSPALAARCEARWVSWARATSEHPTAQAAAALRSDVRVKGWKYLEVLAAATGLAARDSVPVDEVMEWILGAAPLPFGPGDEAERRAGRNGYAHTDLEVVVDALSLLQVGPHDTFVDLGSGLGLPCVVAALRGAGACRGIELHAPYVDRSRANAQELGLTNVEFRVGDVATADWAEGTAFYLFNPFPEPTLRLVAERLRELSARKPIRVACFHTALPGFTQIGGEGKIALYRAG